MRSMGGALIKGMKQSFKFFEGLLFCFYPVTRYLLSAIMHDKRCHLICAST